MNCTCVMWYFVSCGTLYHGLHLIKILILSDEETELLMLEYLK